MNADAGEMKAALQSGMVRFMNDFREKNALSTAWKTPLLGFADAGGAYIRSLRTLVSPTHYLPQDFLPDCRVVLSYFLPFVSEIGRSNLAGAEPSPVWITAYNETNRLFPALNEHLAGLIGSWGYRAVSPQPVGMIDSEHLYSNWSQRHVAYAAGLGTFGVNNLLITPAGSCGRFYSLITDLPVTPDQPMTGELCLYKSAGLCGVCVERCPIRALRLPAGFDRQACASRLDGFERRLGADACGKCAVGLPCSSFS